jgi:hypothetical protein
LQFQYFVAVDVGGTNTRVVLGYPDGRFLTVTKYMVTSPSLPPSLFLSLLLIPLPSLGIRSSHSPWWTEEYFGTVKDEREREREREQGEERE